MDCVQIEEKTGSEPRGPRPPTCPQAQDDDSAREADVLDERSVADGKALRGAEILELRLRDKDHGDDPGEPIAPEPRGEEVHPGDGESDRQQHEPELDEVGSGAQSGEPARHCLRQRWRVRDERVVEAVRDQAGIPRELRRQQRIAPDADQRFRKLPRVHDEEHQGHAHQRHGLGKDERPIAQRHAVHRSWSRRSRSAAWTLQISR